MKSRVVYLILTLFLGMTGIHDCYLNKNKTGIFTLVCTIIGVGLLFLGIGIIFLIPIQIKTFCNLIDGMSKSDKTFNNLYNN